VRYKALLIGLAQYEAPGISGRPGEGIHLKLAELASTALLLQRPFREVAAEATRLGFHHEAENWFDADH